MRLYVAVGILLLGLTASAQRAPRNAWEWTLDERIAARTDAAAQRARVAEVIGSRDTNGLKIGSNASVADSPTFEDSLQGSRHPELLMPTEIFTIFMRSAYLHEDQVARDVREDAESKIVEANLPLELLRILELEATDFIDLQRQEDSLREAAMSAKGDPTVLFTQIKDLDRAECPIRAAVIERMRTRLGGNVFERFLYEIVAPGVYKQYGTAPDAATLRSREEGCR